MRLSATRLSATGGNKGQLPFNKFISALLSKSGRVAAYYGESWDEILAYNAVQVAAGTPANCVAFEDSAGRIPLVAPLGSGKGCGLLLDRSLGLVRGPELLANGDFSAGSTGWTTIDTAPGVTSFGSGKATLATNGSGGVARLRILVPVVVGRTYEVTVGTIVGGAGDAIFTLGTTGGGSQYSLISGVAAASNSKQKITATSTDLWISFYKAAPPIDEVYVVDSVSVKEISGNCRIQTSATARGAFYTSPSRLKYQTDDWAKSSINPAGANRAFVLTALRVNSSASLGVLAEYGPTAASTDGTFSLESLSSQITLRVRGAPAGTTVSASVADSSYVVIGALIDLASPRQELFINGVSAGVSTAAIGSTTFAERDLFVGARNGASAFADAGYTAPLMAVFMQPGDPGLTSAEISRLTEQFKKSIAGY